MALEEATRPITVREGDKVVTLPAMRALFRSMFCAAAQGNTKSQRTSLELVGPLEGKRASNVADFVEHALKYKVEMQNVLAEQARAGTTPPQMTPHPDDIHLDLATGAVTIDGPITPEQAGAEEITFFEIAKQAVEYEDVQRQLKANPSDTKLKKRAKELKPVYDHQQSMQRRAVRRQAEQDAREALTPEGVKRVRKRYQDFMK